MDFNNELNHSGILGQRWGIRRYQNDDGTLTEEGKKRYGKDPRKNPNKRQPISEQQYYKENGQIIKDNFNPKELIKNVLKVNDGYKMIGVGLGAITLGKTICKKYSDTPAAYHTAAIVNGLAITGGLLTTIGGYKMVKGVTKPAVSTTVNIKRNLDTYLTGRRKTTTK